MIARLAALLLLALCVSCPAPVDAVARVDAGARVDAAARDAGTAVDAGAVNASAGDAGGRGVGGGAGAGGGGGGKRFQPPVVYLDGAPIAMMTFGELPPTMKTTWLKLPSLEEPVRRFALSGYLTALGVDLQKLRAAHLYSGRDRVAVLSGEELRREANTTFFSFTQSTTGKVQMRWPSVTPTTDRIDKVVTIALYVDKKPPVRKAGHPGLLFLDDVPVDEPPYITTDVQGGTRVYLDGRLATILRPRDLMGEGPHPLLATLRARGVVAAPASAEFVWNDKPALKLEAGALADAKFTMPTGAGGLLRIEDGPEQVSAVLLYQRAAPPDWSAR